jgi:hypothetical protein
MKTVHTNYGHLEGNVEYHIGIRTRKVGDRSVFYGHVSFMNGKHKRTQLTRDEADCKTFVTACIEHSKLHDFPFTDEHGTKQWFDFNPEAPSFIKYKA